MSVNVGTLEGLLRWKVDSAELDRSLNEVAKKADVSRKELNSYQKEIKSLTSSYERVAASLDPVTANNQKYERAQRTLSAALKAGIITQDQYNKSLSQAKEKYLGVGASTLTWREEIQRLTNVISPFSGTIGSLSASITNVGSSLGLLAKGSTQAGEGLAVAAGGATLTTSAIITLSAALLPLAIALGAVYVAAKSFEFLTNAVKEGIQTQLIIERLNESLRATGSYSQMSSAQLVALAESYELVTGKQKEQIIAAELVLSRFESLNQKAFPEALRLSLAYARSLGVTAEEAAKRLGPALEGNTRSLGALKDAGIVMTASQKKLLTSLIDQGEKTKYQTALFEILRGKVGELSTEYDSNLSRQAGRASVILQDFGEAIANEVIPAIEDLVSELVNSLGGWDALKKKVNELGGAIGNFIRTAIYGLMIAFHELGATVDSIVANVAKGISTITRVHGVLRGSVNSLSLSNTFKEISEGAVASAAEHGEAILRLSRSLADHRTALEGNEEVYSSLGNTIGDVLGETDKLNKKVQELSNVYAENTLELEKLYALRTLAAGGPGSLSEERRLREEQRINDEYEYRIDLLREQSKWGKEIGLQLANMKRDLKELARKTKIELSLSMELEPLKVDVKNAFGKVDEQLKLSLEKLGQVVAKENEVREAQQQTWNEFDKQIEDFARGWKDSFKSMKEVAGEEIEKVKTAVNQGVMTVAEGEKAIAIIRQDYINYYIDQWSGFFSYLGNAFGGIFQRIAGMIQSIQSSQQMGSQIGGSISGIGSVAGGYAGIIIGVVTEVYKWMKSESEKRKQESYNYGAVLSKGPEGWSSPLMGETRRASIQIKDTIEALAEAIGGVFTTFAALEIEVRRDGQFFHAFVEGVLVGSFKDMQSAVEATLLEALKSPSSVLAGISDLVREGLEYVLSDDVVKVGTLDELQDFLVKLKTISDLSLSPTIVGLQSTMREFNRLREVLNKLDQSSQTVIKAQEDLTRAQVKAVNDTIDAMLGIDRAANKALADLLAFQKGLPAVADSFTSGLMESIKAAQRRLNELNNPGIQRTDPGGGGQGSGGGGVYNPGGGIRFLADTTDAINEEKRRLEQAIADWTKQLGDVPKALTTQQLDLGIYTALEPFIRNMKDSAKYAEMMHKFELMRLDAVFGELKLQIIALGRWEEWAKTWEELYNAAKEGTSTTTTPRNRGGGSSGSSKDSIRDFIKDTKFELSLVGLTEYQKSLKQLDRQYDDLIRQAGKDKKLKQELMDLKEKELKQLAREEAERVRSSYRDFMGLTTPFDRIRKTAADLIKEIKASPLGDAEKAKKVSNVLDEINRQVVQLSREMARDILGNLISDMQRFGATEAQMLEARTAHAILEHQLKLASYAVTIAQLEAEGKLSAEVMATIHAAYDFLASIDPTKFITPVVPPIANDNQPLDYTGGGGVYTYQDYEDLLGSIRDQLAEWNRIPLSETLSRAHEITDSFNAMMEDIDRLRQINPFNPEIITLTAEAQEAYQNLVRNFIDETLGEFEDVTEGLQGELEDIGERFTDINAALLHIGASQEDLARAEAARLLAVKRAIDQYLDPIRQFRQEMRSGPLSILTGEQRYNEAQRRFREAYARVQAGDLSGLGDITNLAGQYQELLHSYTGGEGLRTGLGEIDDALADIERLVPGFASQIAEMGTPANPMYVIDANSATMSSRGVDLMKDAIRATNRGNELLLDEMRISNSEMKKHTDKLTDIRGKINLLHEPVRMIA